MRHRHRRRRNRAKAALTGAPGLYFGEDAYTALLRSLYGENYRRTLALPHLLLFTWPLAQLPYFLAVGDALAGAIRVPRFKFRRTPSLSGESATAR